MEAEKYQVLPLDNSVVARLISPKPSLSAGRTVFTYSGEVTGTPNGDAPSILNSSYNLRPKSRYPMAVATACGSHRAIASAVTASTS
jgi:hypothetical protein